MSSSIRPIRRAAQIAAIRINEYLKADNSNSDSDSSATNTPNPQNENSIDRARKNGYDDTLYICSYLLEQLNNAEYEDQRTEIAEKMFQILNKNPNILIYEPRFRNSVLNKIDDLTKHINNRTEEFNKTKYKEALLMMKLSMRKNIRNSQMRLKIYNHLSEIKKILSEYDTWMIGSSIKNQMNQLKNTIDLLKNHPSYVNDSRLLYC
jgi:hypothetical protein